MADQDRAQETISLDRGERAAAQPAKSRHGIATARNAFMSNSADEKMMASPIDRSIDELCINTIRTLSMDAVQQAESGHPGTPMALAPVIYTCLLYTSDAADDL